MKVVRVVAVAAAAGLLAAGCGSSGSSGSSGSNGIANDSASAIVTAAFNALKSASSVTISGSQTKSGKTTDLNGVFFSSDDIDTTLTENGISFQLIKVGGTDYLKAPSAYWQSQGLPSADLSKVNNVWVSVADSVAGVGSELSLSALAASLDKNLGTLTKGGTSTVAGQSVIAVNSSNQGTLYVATTGTAYPVEATGKPGSANGGTLNFSNWNQGQAPTAPAGAETLAQLGLGGGSTGGTGGATGATGAPS
jgi:hypothetical protein